MVVKQCPTCKVEYAQKAWEGLPLLVVTPDEGRVCEVRKCVCGKALTALVTP